MPFRLNVRAPSWTPETAESWPDRCLGASQYHLAKDQDSLQKRTVETYRKNLENVEMTADQSEWTEAFAAKHGDHCFDEDGEQTWKSRSLAEFDFMTADQSELTEAFAAKHGDHCFDEDGEQT